MHVLFFPVWVALSMHWCVKIYWAVSSSVTPSQLTAASVHSSKRPSQTPKCRAEAWGLSLSWTEHLSVQLTDHRCRQRRMGQQSRPQTLRICTPDACAAFGHLQGTVNVSVMGLKDGDGNEHTVIHQPSMALVPFRYRYPLRHKAPAASSARLTHNIGHQCGTTPFSSLRNALSRRSKCLSIQPNTPLHAQWTEVNLSCVERREILLT